MTSVAVGSCTTWRALNPVKADGTAWSWGLNGDGQLCDGTRTGRTTPVHVQLSDVAAMTGGSYFSGILRADGTVWACGFDLLLGNGATQNSETPVQVSNLSAMTSVSAGSEHDLALGSDGSAWGWGFNFSGQLGRALSPYVRTAIKRFGDYVLPAAPSPGPFDADGDLLLSEPDNRREAAA